MIENELRKLINTKESLRTKLALNKDIKFADYVNYIKTIEDLEIYADFVNKIFMLHGELVNFEDLFELEDPYFNNGLHLAKGFNKLIHNNHVAFSNLKTKKLTKTEFIEIIDDITYVYSVMDDYILITYEDKEVNLKSIENGYIFTAPAKFEDKITGITMFTGDIVAVLPVFGAARIITKDKPKEVNQKLITKPNVLINAIGQLSISNNYSNSSSSNTVIEGNAILKQLRSSDE